MKKTRILFLCGLLISVVQVGFTQVRYLKAVGGLGNEEAKRMIQTSDGNYVAVGYFYCVGYTNSWRKAGTTTQGDIFLVKIEPDGDVAWAKNFGEPTIASNYTDTGIAIAASKTSGVVISGVTGSGNSTESDIVAIRVQPDGRGAFAKRTDTCPDNSSSSATLPPVFESLQGFNGTVNAPAAASTTMSANTITPNVFKFVFSQPVLSAK